jgi:DNA-binding response OmpR family regulator
MGVEAASTAPFRFVLDEATRILAVDDDPIQLEFASAYLSTPTASVETAERAEIGLEKLKSDRFDLLLVDLQMPGMDGFDMIRRVRAEPELAELPIVVVTGLEDIVNIDRAYDAGASSFVTKPVNWRLLSYHLRFVLRAHRQARERLRSDAR